KAAQGSVGIKRKYGEEIKLMGLGVYPSCQTVKKHLESEGFTESEIKNNGLLNNSFEGRISIPYPDQSGNICGFSFRIIKDQDNNDSTISNNNNESKSLNDSEINNEKNESKSLNNNEKNKSKFLNNSKINNDENKSKFLNNSEVNNNKDQPKYLNTSGLNKDGLVGFQFRPYQPQRVLVVEGYLDALLLNSLGLKNYWILALGGTSLTNKQIKVIEDSGVKEILLALDNDNAGKKATMKAIEALKLSKLRVYALNWRDAGEIKDPDEFVIREGVDNFSLFLELACQSWGEWVAEYLYNQFPIGNPLGNDGYINQCLEIESTISDPLERKIFTSKFLEYLSDEGITEEDLALRRREKLEKTSKGKAKNVITSLCRELNKNLQEESFTDSELAIEKSLQELKTARGIQLPSPYLPEDLLQDIALTGEGLSTGYEKLDQLCLIPKGAITLIAARPSMGKTTLMLNLFLNQINLYPEQSFYFFSYEESKARLGVKLIQNLSGKIINRDFNHNAYIRYFKVHREQKQFDDQIERGFQTYSTLVKEGRLWLLDDRLNDLDLVTTINLLSESRHIGGIFIDYVQKIPSSNQSFQDWLNIKNVSQSILDCAVSLDIPIILGCQLNRAIEGQKDKRPSLGQLRQSGDLEQDANLVLGLYRDEFYNPDSSDAGKLEVNILKNRNGVTGSKCELLFTPETLKISNSCSQSIPDNDFGF
ncbi:DnaB-like helicase C-terminal domain-containing protein, partial [Geminocystis sp. CENA526]|uniref:DnaB-like helicase C-terminal domain-containing protein n=1 Tax=Geminocystis sp. CENA526 TaxID=1355871 RepID=UPI003D6FC539